MFFELGAYQDGGLSRFERCNRFASTAKIKGVAASVGDGCHQFVFYFQNFLGRRLSWILDVQQFVKKTELCIVLYVVGQRRDGLAELVEFLAQNGA